MDINTTACVLGNYFGILLIVFLLVEMVMIVVELLVFVEMAAMQVEMAFFKWC